jgi:hypothetical protein
MLLQAGWREGNILLQSYWMSLSREANVLLPAMRRGAREARAQANYHQERVEPDTPNVGYNYQLGLFHDVSWENLLQNVSEHFAILR